MKPLVTVALLGLLAYYVSGRAIMLENDSSNVINSANYDQCMMKCQDAQDTCEAECGNGEDAEAVACRNGCADAYQTCTTGTSSEDENIPYYKREVKRNCQDLIVQSLGGNVAKKDEIDYEFIMRQ